MHRKTTFDKSWKQAMDQVKTSSAQSEPSEQLITIKEHVDFWNSLWRHFEIHCLTSSSINIQNDPARAGWKWEIEFSLFFSLRNSITIPFVKKHKMELSMRIIVFT